MPVGTRDILVAVRARDVASRVIREVGANVGRMGGQIAAAKAEMAAFATATKAASAAHIASIQNQNRALSTHNAQLALQTAQHRKLAASGAITAQQMRQVSVANSEVAATNRLTIAQNRQLIASEQQRAAAAIAAHKAEQAAIMEKIALQQAHGRRLVNIGAAMTAVGVVTGAAGAAGIAALKGMADEAIEYGRQVAYARTQVDDLTISQQELEAMVLRAGRNIPVPIEQMNEALYDIFSTVDVGLEGSEHMLTEFSKAAVAGQTDVRTAARATMALMNAYQLPLSETSRLLDMQFKLVQKGVGEYDDFANQLNKLIPLAASTGQEIETMFGLLTTMTRRTGDAATSATALARGMQAFTRPEAVENMEKLGVKVADADGNFRQMDDIIMDLMSKFHSLGEVEFGAALTEGFGREGRIRMQNFFRIMREGIVDAGGRVDALTDSAGVMHEKFEQMADQPYAKMELFRKALEEFRITMGQEVIPLLTPLITKMTELAHKWSDLSPTVRRNIVLFAAVSSAMLLVIGVLTTLVGVFLMIKGAFIAAGVSMGVVALKAALVGAAFFALIGVAYLLIFHFDEVKAFMRGAFVDIENGAWQLVKGFTNAMIQILRVAIDVATAVHRALQYINPMARHSPSLVEDVTSGVREIVVQYSNLGRVIPALDGARAAVERFHASVKGARDAVDAAARAELEDYLSLAGAGAVAAYDAAERAVAELEEQLVSIDQEYQRQYDTLEELQREVDRANEAVTEQEEVVKAAEQAIKRQEYALSQLRNTLRNTSVELDTARDRFQELEDEVRDIERAISDAESRMQEFARAPLEGTKEFSDQLFELDQEAARVRQEMLRWEAAGAPPEALDYFRLQLEEINRQAEALRLQEQLELDPLRRQLEDAANATEELTFEEALEGINKAKDEIASLRDELPKATQRMLDQGKVVEQLEALYALQEAAVESAEAVMAEYRLGLEQAQLTLQEHQQTAQEATEAYQAQQEVLQGLEDAYRSIATEIGNLHGQMEEIKQVAQENWQAIESAAKSAGKAAGGAAEAGGDALEALAGLEPGDLGEAWDDLGESIHGVDNFINDAKKSGKDLAKRLEELEDLGKKLAPILNAVAGGLLAITAVKIIGWLGTVIGLVGGPRALIGLLSTLDRVIGVGLMAAFRGLATFFSATLVPLLIRLTTSIIPALGGALAFLAANPIVLIIAAIALLVLGLGILIIKVGGAREAVNRAWEGIKDATLRLRANLIGAFRLIQDKFLEWAENMLRTASKAFGWVPGVGEKLREAHAAVKEYREKSNAELAALQRKIRYEADVSPAMREMGRLREAARQIERDFGYNIGTREAGGVRGGITQAAQHGGAVRRGMLLVGEAGPELLQLGTTGRVYTNQESSRMLQGTSGNHVTIEEGAIQLKVEGSIDSATLPDVERMLQDTVDQLSDELRSRFGE